MKNYIVTCGYPGEKLRPFDVIAKDEEEACELIMDSFPDFEIGEVFEI